MTTLRHINRTAIIALFVFGLSSIFGLGFIMYRVLPQIAIREPGVLILLPGVVVAIVAGLFIFGVFLGYFYRNPTARWLINKKTRTQFRHALSFERGERIRLERELYETKKAVVGLKDKLTNVEESGGGEKSGAQQELLDKIEQDRDRLEKKHDQLMRDLEARKQRIADLMTEIAIAQTEAEEARGEVERLKSNPPPSEPQRLELAVAAEDASIKDVLANVSQLDGVEMVLVADDFGLVVETSDTGDKAENLAAASSLVSRIASKLKDILPVGAISTIEIGDVDGYVLDVKYFELFQLRCSLTIVRDDTHIYPGLADQTIEAIVARLQD